MDHSTLSAAYSLVTKHAHRTPVLSSRTLNTMTGGELFFKAENFQKMGAFKFRGASNAVFSLTDEEAKNGVATHSSGNHAQALALAAKMRGIPAYIVMPETAPQVKVSAVKGYGGRIIFCEPTQKAREEMLENVIERVNGVFVHPSDDLRVIAGQGTAAMELFRETGDLDIVMTPVGGGGLLSGTALAAAFFSPRTRAIGAEPVGADDAYRSFTTGVLHPSVEPKTIADGLLTSLGPNTFGFIREHVSEIVRVSEQAIIEAMKLIWERMKIIIEPSAAVPVGALLSGALEVRGKRVGIILSGGNVDLDKLPWTQWSTV